MDFDNYFWGFWVDGPGHSLAGSLNAWGGSEYSPYGYIYISRLNIYIYMYIYIYVYIYTHPYFLPTLNPRHDILPGPLLTTMM